MGAMGHLSERQNCWILFQQSSNLSLISIGRSTLRLRFVLIAQYQRPVLVQLAIAALYLGVCFLF